MSASVRGYIPSLDGFRAVAILIVFLAHAGLEAIIPGGFGVTLFFFLSGYLITRLMIREDAKQGTISLSGFYMRRFWRIMPPFFIIFVAALLLAQLGVLQGEMDSRVILGQLLFFSNYTALLLPDVESVKGLGILWSLAVEEHFYFVWPFVFLMIRHWRHATLSLWIIILAILAWRTLRFCVFGSTEAAIYLSTDTRFDSLLFGCLLAMLENRRLERINLTSLAVTGLASAALALILVSLVVRDPTFRSTLRYSLQGLALMPLFHLAVRYPDHGLFSWLNWRYIRWIGTLSYGIYLVHMLILHGLEHAFPHYSGLAIGLIGALISILVAVMLNLWIERPFARLRHRLQS